MRSIKEFRWIKKHEKAFKQLRWCLEETPTLLSPKPGENIHISALQIVVSVVPIKE